MKVRMTEHVGKLDAAPTLADHRDHLLAAEIAAEEMERRAGEKHWRNPRRLDQQKEGACVGFGCAGFLNSAPRKHDFDSAYAFDLYHYVTTIDQFPGDWRTGQQGTDVRVGIAS